MIHSVVHIVDDASWGGVNRLLDVFERSESSATTDHHKIMRIERGQKLAPRIDADVVVSHVSICWKNIPFLSALRSANPERALIHVEHSYSSRYVALKVENRSRFEDLLRLGYSLFDKVVCVSHPQAEWMKRREILQPDQLATISSCVKLDPFEAIAHQRPTGPVTIGAIGRFHEQKGFDILVEAFVHSAPRHMQLLLVGDGPERSKLTQLAEGSKSVLFMPYSANPAEAMALCDVIAMPSRWEPYGLVALEAMAAGRPVVCSSVDGLRQHIACGAIEVPQNTVEGWSGMIEHIGERHGLQQMPVGSSHIRAQDLFASAWNALVAEVVAHSVSTQMAA